MFYVYIKRQKPDNKITHLEKIEIEGKPIKSFAFLGKLFVLHEAKRINKLIWTEVTTGCSIGEFEVNDLENALLYPDKFKEEKSKITREEFHGKINRYLNLNKELASSL